MEWIKLINVIVLEEDGVGWALSTYGRDYFVGNLKGRDRSED
jgi:hypothetical protein